LDGVAKSRADRLVGILNGVDYTAWNPEKDKLIAVRYSANDLSGKKVCKQSCWICSDCHTITWIGR